MKTQHILATATAAAVAVASLAVVPAASAAPAMTTVVHQTSVYEVAINTPSQQVLEVEPQAIPAVVAGAAKVSWTAFKAAQAPQQAGQVLRAASFLQNFMGGSSVKHLDAETDANIDVIFDH